MYSILNLWKNSVALPLFRLYQRAYLLVILFFIWVFLFIFHLVFPFLNYDDINVKFLHICLRALVFFLATYEYIFYVIHLLSTSFLLFISTFQFIPSCYLFIFHKVNSLIFSLLSCFGWVIMIGSLFVIED